MPSAKLLFACVLAALPAAPRAGELAGPLTAPATVSGTPLSFSVYLPDAAAAGGDFPVVYLLHGFGASQREWIDAGRVADLLDRMIADGEIAPLIAVMPDAGKSWYVDSAHIGGPGDYETAILRDLVPEVDRRFPTLPDRAHRGIAGVSMGGFGALRLAFAHPDVFGAVAGLSPGLFKRGALSWEATDSTSPDELETWFPGTFGRPFDADLYMSESPFAYVDGMNGPPAILLAVGDDDYFELHDGTVELYLDLRAAGLKPELRVGNGGHDWGYWRSIEPEVFRFFDTVWHLEHAPE